MDVASIERKITDAEYQIEQVAKDREKARTRNQSAIDAAVQQVERAQGAPEDDVQAKLDVDSFSNERTKAEQQLASDDQNFADKLTQLQSELDGLRADLVDAKSREEASKKAQLAVIAAERLLDDK